MEATGARVNSIRWIMMARDAGIWLIAATLVMPLSWTALTIHGKPIDVIPSDFLLIVLPLCVVRWHRLAGQITETGASGAMWLRRAVIALALYCGVSALIGWMRTGDVVGLLSAAKFVKPFVFVMIGGWLATVIGPWEMLRRIVWGFAVMMLVLAMSTALNPDFPGIAWGAQWMGQPIYGFPNLAMSFAGAMLPLLLAVAETSRTKWQRWIAAAAVAATFVLVVSSLSRSAVVVMLSGMTIYLLLTGLRWVPIGFAAVAVLYVGTGYSLLVLQSDSAGDGHAQLQERAAHRFVAPVNQDSGALAGRSTIWSETWRLIGARPWLGYAFEPYSDHSEFGTPHQQYLEVLYKAGSVGLVLYAAVLCIAIGGLVQLWWRLEAGRTRTPGVLNMHNPHSPNSAQAIETPQNSKRSGRCEEPISETRHLLAGLFALLFGLLLGNLSQANLTYSLTGNCLFLMIGLLVHSHSSATYSRHGAEYDDVLPQTDRPSTGRWAA